MWYCILLNFTEFQKYLKIHEFYWILKVQVLKSQFMMSTVLFTNGKMYQNLWPLNDFERRNGFILCDFTKYGSFLSHVLKLYVKKICSP